MGGWDAAEQWAQSNMFPGPRNVACSDFLKEDKYLDIYFKMIFKRYQLI